MDTAMSTTSAMAASFYNETSSDEFPSDSSSSSNESDGGSDDDGENSLKFKSLNKSARKFSPSREIDGNRDGDSDDGKRGNIFLKLLNRENTGYFNSRLRGRSNQRAFRKVPTRLSFCLKDIVPYCYLQGHMFMGLTVCGQFLISYKVCYDENSLANAYNFSTHYKYTLYFWIYRPHQPLGKYYKICLFDDHGVDNLKTVTMTQWLSSPHVLVVHGASEYENEDSYLTIVRVPKLGCLDCKELRDFDADGYIRCDALCIKCNLTIHTKYSTTESDPRFNPHLNLICPERIVFVANGFVHMLHIELEAHKQSQQSPQHQFHSNHLQQAKMNLHHSHTPPTYCSPTLSIVGQSNISTTTNLLPRGDTKTANDSSQTDVVEKSCDPSPTLSLPSSTTDTGCDNKNNIVARIIADFSEFENDIQTLSDKNNRRTDSKTLNYNELIFTCGSSSIANPGGSDSDPIGKNLTAGRNQTATKVTLLNHQGRRNHKIITKSYSNCVTTVDLQFCGGSGGSSSGAATDKDNAYVFSEDNENCEKIGTFRKRRLADKKYAFSEDNSENIIPFTKARLTTQTPRIHRTFASNHHHSSHPGTVYLSTTSSQSYETTSHLHRASPSQGFRSPCGSPVGSNRFLRSPPGRTSQKSPTQQQQQQLGAVRPLNSLSPRQIVFPKRAAGERGGDVFSSTSPILSPRRDETAIGTITDGVEKPTCTKKFKRRYVEEDDAASVITSEEDDCISPGYHTSLPMEVHGSCYSDMQMISETSYQKLKCPTVIITQHSFDLDTFTYHVISNLCQSNNKTYDVFYDWACEVVNVCPHSNSIVCILMAHFTARDQLPNSSKKCVNCSRNLDCAFHRKQFECRIFFTWNMETGVWDVLDYGQLLEVSNSTTIIIKADSNRCLTKIAKTLANELISDIQLIHNYTSNLNVLDSNVDKSKDSLIDINNSIEFYRKRAKLLRSEIQLN